MVTLQKKRGILRGCRVHSLKIEAIHELVYIFNRNPLNPFSLRLFFFFKVFCLWLFALASVRQPSTKKSLDEDAPSSLMSNQRTNRSFAPALMLLKSSCQPVALLALQVSRCQRVWPRPLQTRKDIINQTWQTAQSQIFTGSELSLKVKRCQFYRKMFIKE